MLNFCDGVEVVGALGFFHFKASGIDFFSDSLGLLDGIFFGFPLEAHGIGFGLKV